MLGQELLAQERRHDHGVAEGDLLTVGELHRAVVDVVDAHRDLGVDALLLEEHPEQLLAVGEPADAEVAEERLGRHVVQAHAVLLSPAFFRW